MNLPYIPRLLCLTLACYFLVYTAAALSAVSLAQRGIGRARALEPDRGAAQLLALRLLPLILGLAVPILLCIPSYIFFEPDLSDEPVGWLCIALASGGLALWALSGARAARALFRSIAFARRCRRAGNLRVVAGETACVIETGTPCLALSGILRSRVVISSGIVNALSEEELAVVLLHENAHRTACDNLKRLCLLLAPGSRALERAWTACAEYAADRKAAQNDERRRLALASALVRVARFGAVPDASAITTSFMADASELESRVNRLLASPECGDSAPRNLWPAAIGCAVLLALCLQPAALSTVHEILELLLQ